MKMNTIQLDIDKYESILKELGVLKTENEELKKRLQTSHNSDYAKSKSCANCSKLYQCNDVRKHPEWHCENNDFA
jgi:hypothetical protein